MSGFRRVELAGGAADGLVLEAGPLEFFAVGAIVRHAGERYVVGEDGKAGRARLLCSNCGEPISEHCTKHATPCCPGRCA